MNGKNAIIDVDNNCEVVDYYKVEFAAPYKFEDTTTNQINLKGLNDLTANDMINTEHVIQRNGSTSFLPEMTLEYSLQLAAKATKMPIEFFEQLPPREALKVKNRVTRFLYGQD